MSDLEPETADETLGSSYALRLSEGTKRQFIHHCKTRLKRPHQTVLRELMDAVVEGRVKITPSEDQRIATEELYS